MNQTPNCKSCGCLRSATPTWTIKGALCNECNKARMRECYYRRIGRISAGTLAPKRPPTVRAELHDADRVRQRWNRVRRMSRAEVKRRMAAMVWTDEIRAICSGSLDMARCKAKQGAI